MSKPSLSELPLMDVPGASMDLGESMPPLTPLASLQPDLTPGALPLLVQMPDGRRKQVELPPSATVNDLLLQLDAPGDWVLNFNSETLDGGERLQRYNIPDAYDHAGGLLKMIDTSKLELREKIDAVNKACTVVRGISRGERDMDRIISGSFDPDAETAANTRANQDAAYPDDHDQDHDRAQGHDNEPPAADSLDDPPGGGAGQQQQQQQQPLLRQARRGRGFSSAQLPSLSFSNLLPPGSSGALGTTVPLPPTPSQLIRRLGTSFPNLYPPEAADKMIADLSRMQQPQPQQRMGAAGRLVASAAASSAAALAAPPAPAMPPAQSTVLPQGSGAAFGAQSQPGAARPPQQPYHQPQQPAPRIESSLQQQARANAQGQGVPAGLGMSHGAAATQSGGQVGEKPPAGSGAGGKVPEMGSEQEQHLGALKRSGTWFEDVMKSLLPGAENGSAQAARGVEEAGGSADDAHKSDDDEFGAGGESEDESVAQKSVQAGVTASSGVNSRSNTLATTNGEVSVSHGSAGQDAGTMSVGGMGTTSVGASGSSYVADQSIGDGASNPDEVKLPKKRGRKRKNPELTDEERKAHRQAQNRESAKQSRQRRKNITAEFEQKVNTLSNENESLRGTITALSDRLQFLQSLLTVSVRQRQPGGGVAPPPVAPPQAMPAPMGVGGPMHMQQPMMHAPPPPPVLAPPPNVGMPGMPMGASLDPNMGPPPGTGNTGAGLSGLPPRPPPSHGYIPGLP